MISRFFKKKPPVPEPKKASPVSSKAAQIKKAPPEKSEAARPLEKPSKFKKLLTAEGWKRMMMRKSQK